MLTIKSGRSFLLFICWTNQKCVMKRLNVWLESQDEDACGKASRSCHDSQLKLSNCKWEIIVIATSQGCQVFSRASALKSCFMWLAKWQCSRRSKSSYAKKFPEKCSGSISALIGCCIRSAPDLSDGAHVARFGWLVLHSVKHQCVRHRENWPASRKCQQQWQVFAAAVLFPRNSDRGWRLSRGWLGEPRFA